MQTITTNRGTFTYRTFGNSDKLPIVLLHGFPQSSYCWVEVAKRLQNGFYFILPDLRGMGDSERTMSKKSYTKDNLAKDVVSMLDAMGIERFCLGGHDWGSGVAQELAHLFTDRIIKFITINFPIINNPIGEEKAYKKLGERQFASFWYQNFLRLPMLAEQFMSGNEAFWIRFTVRGIKHQIDEVALEEYVRCQKIPNSIVTFANLYRTMHLDFKRWKTSGYLQEVLPIDTLVIHGTLDTVIVKEYLENVENCFSSVRVAYLESGHFVPDESPEEVAVLISAFLS